jgi:hypothetical protein
MLAAIFHFKTQPKPPDEQLMARWIVQRKVAPDAGTSGNTERYNFRCCLDCRKATTPAARPKAAYLRWGRFQ